MRKACAWLALFLSLLWTSTPALYAGFGGTDLILPAVGRVDGLVGSHFYTTIDRSLLDAHGIVQGHRTIDLRPWEPASLNAATISGSLVDGTLRVTGISGSGRALVLGSQVANASQDASAFEMAFRQELISG